MKEGRRRRRKTEHDIRESLLGYIGVGCINRFYFTEEQHLVSGLR